MTREIRPEGSGCPACDAYHRSQREGARAAPLPEQTMESYLDWLENTPLDQLPPGEVPGQGEQPSIEELIEASSLGTPQAKAIRAEGKRMRRRLQVRTALSVWENAVVNAHGGNARKTPLLTAAQLIKAGDMLAEILKDEIEPDKV